jgi:peptidoglycan/LPS O-acetylase OafA/YrhL
MDYKYVQGDERTLYVFNLDYVAESYRNLLHGALFFYHLWFLGALLVFYAVVAVGMCFFRNKSIRSKLLLLNSKAQNHAGPAALVFLGLLTLASFVTSSPKHWSEMVPMARSVFSDPVGLFYYFGFFVAGFLLCISQKIADVFAKKFKWLLLAAFVLLAANAYAAREERLLHESFSLFLRMSVPMITVCLCFGLFGLFESVAKKPNRWVLALSPASYSFYLWNPFITVCVIAFLRPSHLGVATEVVLGSVIVIFLTYASFFLWEFAKSRAQALYRRSEEVLAQR